MLGTVLMQCWKCGCKRLSTRKFKRATKFSTDSTDVSLYQFDSTVKLQYVSVSASLHFCSLILGKLSSWVKFPN